MLPPLMVSDDMVDTVLELTGRSASWSRALAVFLSSRYGSFAVAVEVVVLFTVIPSGHYRL
jgi:hypothetical protein